MAGKILELRVHGVSNTPPANVLGEEENKEPRRVAGNVTTGFYRPAEEKADQPEVEAYSWGQLTSGQRAVKDIQRALWTLLLPFTLANVALHARPDIPANGEKFRSSPGINGWLIRVFGLTLTATMVLAATGVGVDLIGWQCVDTNCLSTIPGPWEFLASNWWHQGGRAMAVGLLVPFALLAVIGLLTWRSYQYEAVVPTHPAQSGAVAVDNPLQQHSFWCGDRQVRRLAVLHLTTGVAAALAVPFAALVVMDPPRGARIVLAVAVGAILVLIPVLAIVALGHSSVTGRGGHSTIGGFCRTVTGLAVAGCIRALWYLLLPDGPAGRSLDQLRPPVGCRGDGTLPGCSEDRSLPGYDDVIIWLAAVQVLLLLAIALVSRVGRVALWLPFLGLVALTVGHLWLRSWWFAAAVLGVVALAMLWPGKASAPGVWGHRGPIVLAGLGWMLGLAYSVGVLYWVTDLLNRGAPPTGASPITLPVPVMWSGLGLFFALLTIAGVGGWTARRFAVLRKEQRAKVVAEMSDGSAHDERRARDVASFRAFHELIGNHGLRNIGVLFTAGLVLAMAGTVAAYSGVRPVPTGPTGWEVAVKIAIDIGDSVAIVLPLLIAALGVQVYRSDSVRRYVGIAWDIGTFWPRSGHPLGPPCYAERAVPELQTRTIGVLTTSNDDKHVDSIILSGHSQGSVICAAVIFQLPEELRGRVWFFSYGCQLTGLYGKVFPAYFGTERLATLSSVLTPRDRSPQWTNFWRATDPIGWLVDGVADQRQITDPVALHPSDGEVADPPIRNHSGYQEAKEFEDTRHEVCVRLGLHGYGNGAGSCGPSQVQRGMPKPVGTAASGGP